MAEAEIDALIERGLAAVEDERLDEVDEILEEARHLGGENHVRVLHLSGLLAWARDDLEHATGYLMQATDLSPTRPEIYLDCAECLFTVDEIDEAESQTRAVLRLPDLPREQEDEARLLLAQLRLADDDPGEALEVLEGIDPARKDHPAFLSTRGAALLADEKFADAVADLKRAIEHEPDDADLHYQLGIALEFIGELEPAREEMKRVLQLDLADWKDVGEELPPPDFAETQELRSRLEDVLEELPDPVLKLVAAAPITVQARATEEQVAAGVNPRSLLGFLGSPQRDDADAKLEGIVIMRDLVLAEVDDDDEIEGELFEALVEEIQVFFRRTDIVFAEG